MIDVQRHEDGAVLRVRAKPGAKQNALLEEHGGALKVAVAAPPEDGKANEAIIALLAEALNLRRAQITLLSGQAHRSKRFLIAGITPDDLLDRIEAVLSPTLYEPPDPEL